MTDKYRNDLFDQKIREKFQGDSIDPDNKMWDRISARIKDQPKPIPVWKPLAIISTFVVLQFLGTVLYDFYFHETGDLLDESTETITTNEQNLMDQSFVEQPSMTIFSESKNDPLKTSQQNSATTNRLKEKHFEEIAPYTREESSIIEGESISLVPKQVIPYRAPLFINDKNLDTINKPLEKRFTIQDEHENTPLADAKERNKKVASHLFFIEMIGFAYHSNRMLRYNSNYQQPHSFTKDYFNKSESGQITLSVGTNFGIRLTQRSNLKFGLNYTNYKLKFQTQGEWLSKVDDSHYQLFTSAGAVNFNLKQGVVDPETVLKSSIFLRYLYIPVTYEYKFGKNYYSNVSMVFGHELSREINWESTGDNLDAEQSFSNSDMKKSTIGISLGLTREQHLSSNTSLLLSLSLTTQLKSMSGSGPVNAYPFMVGLGLGLRHYFE